MTTDRERAWEEFHTIVCPINESIAGNYTDQNDLSVWITKPLTPVEIDKKILAAAQRAFDYYYPKIAKRNAQIEERDAEIRSLKQPRIKMINSYESDLHKRDAIIATLKKLRVKS